MFTLYSNKEIQLCTISAHVPHTRARAAGRTKVFPRTPPTTHTCYF